MNNKWTADSVGPGWKHLVQPLLDLCDLYNLNVHQVKEKFGTLRFYCDFDDRLQSIVDAAEAASGHTCEECGEHGVVRWDPETRRPIYKAKTGPVSEGGYWVLTLCDPCRASKNQRGSEPSGDGAGL